MWDTRPVELVLHLPEGLADDVEEAVQNDPELLSRIIRYGFTRRAMFQQLNRSRGKTAGGGGVQENTVHGH